MLIHIHAHTNRVDASLEETMGIPFEVCEGDTCVHVGYQVRVCILNALHGAHMHILFKVCGDTCACRKAIRCMFVYLRTVCIVKAISWHAHAHTCMHACMHAYSLKPVRIHVRAGLSGACMYT
jgi:hypothetical protein